ncbi:ankyrin, partial [Rozella allomycis CSF55]
NSESETPLLIASYKGFSKIVEILVDRGSNILHQDKDGWTAFHNAAAKGHLKILQLLLAKNFPIDKRSFTGKTALMLAASKGNIEVIKFLLENFANPCLQDTYGEFPYEMCAGLPCLMACEMILE